MLIIITGLPGTGKTTIAEALSEEIGARHFSSDIIREELKLKGQYNKTAKETIYRKIKQLTADALQKGATVIVDATFYKEELRREYEQLARKAEVKSYWIEMKATETSLKKRLQKKRPHSQADFSVYQKIKKEWEPLHRNQLVLQSDQMDMAEMIDRVTDFIDLKS